MHILKLISLGSHMIVITHRIDPTIHGAYGLTFIILVKALAVLHLWKLNNSLIIIGIKK